MFIVIKLVTVSKCSGQRNKKSISLFCLLEIQRTIIRNRLVLVAYKNIIYFYNNTTGVVGILILKI